MIASRLSVRRGFTVVMKSGALSLPVATSQRNLLTHLASSSLATAWKIISCLINEFSPFSVCLFLSCQSKNCSCSNLCQTKSSKSCSKTSTGTGNRYGRYSKGEGSGSQSNCTQGSSCSWDGHEE